MLYRVISADSHVVEDPRLWEERMPRDLRDRAPHLERTEKGDYLFIEGHPPAAIGRFGLAGKTPEEIARAKHLEDNRPGGWDPQARLKDMDADGVDADVLYPTVSNRFFRVPSGAYQTACIRAYNDWLAEFCNAAPKRLKGLGIIPLADVAAGIQEMQRVRKLGLQGVMIAIYPEEARPYSDPAYDPLWSAAQDMGMPVSLHVLSNANLAPLAHFMVDYAAMPQWVQRSLAAMIFGGVFERYPRLRVVSAESDIGWIGNFLQRIDHAMHKHGLRLGVKLSLRPSEYFRRGCSATFMDDVAGMRGWDLIGPQCIMWSSDYPHTDSTWPRSQDAIARNFAAVPEGPKRQMLADNAASLYGFE